MDRLATDIRYAIRQLRRRPGFAGVAVLTLALGIGANTAIFSVIDAVLLRPLPYGDPDRLVMVWTSVGESDRAPISEPELRDYREGIASLDRVAAYRAAEANLTGSGEPERVPAAAVTANVFDVLGVAPLIGRPFHAGEGEPGEDGVVVIGHGLWQRRFGGDPAIVGQSLEVNGQLRTVVGVMPPRFRLPGDFQTARPTEVWTPLPLDLDAPGGRGRRHLTAVARLAPGATLEGANAELGSMARRWWADGLVSDERIRGFAVPVREEVVGDARPAFLILFAAVSLVLLIACANVANLLLARMEERQRELAVRTALGAQRDRIIRQLLSESLVLAVLGGAAGLLLAAVGLRVITGLAPASVPGLDAIALDGRMLAFTAMVTLLAAFLFGIIPAMRSANRSPGRILRDGGRSATAGRGHQRARQLLVTAEVGLAVVLVIGAGLLMRSFAEMRQVELGFEPDGVLSLQLSLPGSDYSSAEEIVDFYRELRLNIAAIPGVRSAGAAALLPLDQTTGDWGIDIQGRVRGPSARFQGHLQIVTPGYAEAMGIALVAGRFVSDYDHGDAPPVVVINERMADLYWRGEDPLGQRIRLRTEDDGSWFTIVGIAGDIRHNAVVEEPRHEMYFPHAQLPLALGGTTAAMSLVVRTAPGEAMVAGLVRETIRTMDPNLPVSNVRLMRDVVASAVAGPRFTMLLLGTFAGIALLLGAVGIYGVIAYTVGRRTHEIGVRMALGAGPGMILGMVVRQGLAMVGAGVLLGLAAAFGATRVLARLLYGVTPTDPLTFAAVPVVLLAVALGASILPARRATRVDPMVALRSD